MGVYEGVCFRARLMLGTTHGELSEADYSSGNESGECRENDWRLLVGHRYAGQGWVSGGLLWLFGGYGLDGRGDAGYLADTWSYLR